MTYSSLPAIHRGPLTRGAQHGGAQPEAQFDLTSFKTMSSVLQDLSHWTLLMERLNHQEMPPEFERQPPANLRQQVIEWVKAVRANELRKNAGDPGPVLARRLSNAEYNYTIRDLTGVDLKPTREFPVDPANQSGFDNTGESLSMGELRGRQSWPAPPEPHRE